jgi:GNAT superfamily N-acetyltransferase
MILSAPVILSEQHDLQNFTCGVISLDDWLKRRAYANQVVGASRTYVVASEQKVVGYYCLASGALLLSNAPGSVRRNMPDPVPMVVLGRLAIDQSWQGRRLGVALLQDAVIRTREAAEIVGVRGLLVHALSEEAKAFYEKHGFVSSPTQPMTLVLSLKNQKAAH